MNIRGGRLRMMRGVIYRLKRGYGLGIAVHYQTGNTVDVTTGVRSVTRDAVFVDRAILLPTQVHKEFKYDIGYLKANSNFTYGGLFTSGTRQVIVDRGDLPRGFEIKATDEFYVVFNHKRYAVKTVTELEVPAYFLALEFTGGVPTHEIHQQKIVERLRFAEGAEGGPSGAATWEQTVVQRLQLTEDVGGGQAGHRSYDQHLTDNLEFRETVSKQDTLHLSVEDRINLADGAAHA